MRCSTGAEPWKDWTLKLQASGGAATPACWPGKRQAGSESHYWTYPRLPPNQLGNLAVVLTDIVGWSSVRIAQSREQRILGGPM